MAEPLRVFLIDPQPGLRNLAQQIAAWLPGSRLVGSAGRAVDGVRAIANLRPDVTVVRWHPEFADYLPALRLLGLAGRGTRLVALVDDRQARDQAALHSGDLVAVIPGTEAANRLGPAVHALFAEESGLRP